MRGCFAGRPHGLAGADLFGWVDGLPGTVPLSLLHAGQVVGARCSGTETGAHHIRLPLRRLPDVDAERYPGTREQPANPDELVFGQRVHRVDDDGADAWGRGFVLEGEGLADHGVEEALGLPRSGAGGDESGAALGDRSDRAFLVAVEVGDLLRNPLGEVRVDEAFADQLLDGSTGPEGAREADVRAPEEGGGAGMVEREKTAHLPEEVRIGEGVGGELVAEEALRDLLDVGDGVQGHGGWGAGLGGAIVGNVELTGRTRGKETRPPSPVAKRERGPDHEAATGAGRRSGEQATPRVAELGDQSQPSSLRTGTGSARMGRRLTAVVERDGNGYVAQCPEVDVASQGDSVAEARANLEEALVLFFETASAEEVERRRPSG